MSDIHTHDWLAQELQAQEPQAPPEAPQATMSAAETRLTRRTMIHDWVLVGFLVLASMLGTILAVGDARANHRADRAGVRGDRNVAAVVDALQAQRASSDAISTLADDFAALAAARTAEERQAVLEKLAVDKAQAVEARHRSDDALAALKRIEAENTARATTAPTSPPAARSSPTTTSTATRPTTTTSTTTTTTTTPPGPPTTVPVPVPLPFPVPTLTLPTLPLKPLR